MVDKDNDVKPIVPCPSCGEEMTIRELECTACDIQVRGRFGAGGRFSGLSPQQWEFLESFLSNRGVIRDIEADLGISYPTVRSRLDNLLAAIGYGEAASRPAKTSPAPAGKRLDVLSALDRGEIDAESALRMLKSD